VPECLRATSIEALIMGFKPDKECEKRGNIVLLSEMIANLKYGKKSALQYPHTPALLIATM
jgi:hypothetical protein